jgi:hypothetical protein
MGKIQRKVQTIITNKIKNKEIVRGLFCFYHDKKNFTVKIPVNIFFKGSFKKFFVVIHEDYMKDEDLGLAAGQSRLYLADNDNILFDLFVDIEVKKFPTDSHKSMGIYYMNILNVNNFTELNSNEINKALAPNIKLIKNLEKTELDNIFKELQELQEMAKKKRSISLVAKKIIKKYKKTFKALSDT